MASQEIYDYLWEIIRKHLPRQKPHIGRPRRDPRSLLNGIFYVLTTGCAWNDVPEKYGTKSTVHRYHLDLCKRGAYQAIFLDLLQAGYDLRKSGDLFFGNGVLSWILERLGAFLSRFLGLVCEK